MKHISILGSTGSIGRQTLDVVREHPHLFRVIGLAASNNWEELIKQIQQFKPLIVSVGNKELADRVKLHSPFPVRVVYGLEGVCEVATHPECHFVLSAIVGSAGLRPTLKAIEAGKTIGLANKEALVTAGHIVMSKAKEHHVTIIPVDSEHSAIFQCLRGEDRGAIRRIILTASGGSFRDLSREQLKHVTVEQALKHPNWKMGEKITIDSATMMNKGLEVIEARWLFDLSFNQIECSIHRESLVHSLVEFHDSAMIAQLGAPDMRVPIQYAMTFPKRATLRAERLDFTKIVTLRFEPIDFDRYPALRLAYECGRQGGTMTTVLNAANEIIVDRFLNGEIPFIEIESRIESVLEKHKKIERPVLEEIFEADQWAREAASGA